MYVIFNQKGFILPVTMVLCLLFPIVIFSEIELYKLDQRFYIEYEEMEKLQSLMQMGVQDLYAQMKEQLGEPIEDPPIIETTAGTLNYPTGWIDYTVAPLAPGTVQIKGKCSTNNERIQYFIVILNIETKEIVKWVEG